MLYGNCCALSGLSAICLLVFMALHTAKAAGRSTLTWAVILTPLMVAATIMLLAAVLAPWMLPRNRQPSLYSRGNISLGALATLTICGRLGINSMATVHSSPPSWAAALAPLAILLLFRAVMRLVSPAGVDPNGRWAHAARSVPLRLSACLELLLAGASLLLLYARLELGMEIGWWSIAGPVIVLQVREASRPK